MRSARRALRAALALLIMHAACAFAQADSIAVGFLSTEPRAARPTPGPLERELARRNPELARRLRFEYRFAEGDVGRLPGLAAELAARRPALLYCSDFLAAKAAAEATAGIPIVFLAHVDPVEQKFLTSLRSSSRNVTGVTTFRPVLVKLLEVALDAFAAARRMDVLLDLTELAAQQSLPSLRELARARAVELVVHDVADERDLLRWLEGLRPRAFDAVVVSSSAATWHNRRTLVATLGRLALPAVYEAPIFVAEGGLMSYGPSYADVVPRIAEYVERVITGTDPAALPILQPTRLELVVNLKAAREQRIALPSAFLRRADRILE